MLTLKVPIKETENIKNILIKKDLIDQDYKPFKEGKFFYFPIKKEIKIKGAEIVNKKHEIKTKQNVSLKESLQYYLTPEEFKKLKTSYDLVGTIAIIEIPEELEPKEEIIAEQLLNTNKNIETVVKKKGIHGGTFRTQQTKYLAGKNTKITLHKETNVKLKINIDNTYFSVRLSTERKRISEQIKKGENILVMFSGAAPYPCVLSKNTKAKHITGIEINPKAHKMGQENVKLNKLTNITLINGDVKTEVPKLKQKFERIAMPLPKTADEFLPTALNVSKSGTIIHFYDFLNVKEFKKANEKIKLACKKADLKCKILKITKCGQHAPRVFRICIDFKIL